MRIQLLGINYAPEKTGIAPYTTGLARHLAKEHDVTVVTGLPHYPDWSVEPECRRWRHEEDDAGVRVIRVSHHVPKTPSARGRAAYELSWASRAAAVGVRIPADVVISVVPALFGAHAGRIVARRHGAALGVFVQDVMGCAAAQSGYGGGRAVAGATSALEKAALRGADSVATIHPRLANELMRLTGSDERPSVIFNWTHVTQRPGDADAMRHRLGWRDDEVVVLHSGNMGCKQNLEVVVDAARIAQAEGRPVRFVLAGGGSQQDKLRDYAAGCDRLDFLGSVDDDVYMDLLAAADILLVNERPGMSEMSLPSKLTSYLVAGRPIVAAVEPGGSTAEFVRASGGGIVVPAGDAGAIVDAAGKLFSDPALSARLAEDGFRFAQQELSADAAMASFDTWVHRLAAARPARSRQRRATAALSTYHR